jgi:hypothetical protein
MLRCHWHRAVVTVIGWLPEIDLFEIGLAHIQLVDGADEKLPLIGSMIDGLLDEVEKQYVDQSRTDGNDHKHQPQRTGGVNRQSDVGSDAAGPSVGEESDERSG